MFLKRFRKIGLLVVISTTLATAVFYYFVVTNLKVVGGSNSPTNSHLPKDEVSSTSIIDSNEVLQKWQAPIPLPERHGRPGELGRPVKIPPNMWYLVKKQFEENQFNLVASNFISSNRSLPDVRHTKCKRKSYPSELPTTSIVIVFHNEAWSTLLRTIWSVINRSPPALLKEIILVDDASERHYLGQILEDYVKSLRVPIFVIRTGNRSGIVKSRLLGVGHVTSGIVTFLDSHCECSQGWLEPLLARISQNRRIVPSPIIDKISDQTFEYVPQSDQRWGGFNRALSFRLYQVPEREMKRRNYDPIAPLRTPIMAGGLYSIDKEFFYEIGSYDEDMDIWGGENIEISFRIWQCGGILEMLPCSHVGHVFRSKTPYTFPGGISKTIFRNLARVAEVWMDEWKGFYYAMNRGAVEVSVGDVSSRKALRERLKCQSFRWYLKNIYPESVMPLDIYYMGVIQNLETETCLDTLGRITGDQLGMNYCREWESNQIFIYTKRQELMVDDLCMEATKVNRPVNIVRCYGSRVSQKWSYNHQRKTISHVKTGNCLQGFAHNKEPILWPCDYSRAQQWLMESNFEWWSNEIGPKL